MKRYAITKKYNVVFHYNAVMLLVPTTVWDQEQFQCADAVFACLLK